MGDWVAVVPQKQSSLKEYSFKPNIRLNEEPNEEQLWWALGVAQAADFGLREKEGGLEAPVEALDGIFSGGQRQRLTIARLSLRQAPFWSWMIPHLPWTI